MLRGQRGRPLLVYLGGWVMVGVSLPALLFIALMVVEAVLDPTGGTFGAFGLNELTAAQLLAVSPALLLLAGAQAAVGYALLTNKVWARPLGTFLWLGAGLLTGGAQAVAGLGEHQYYGSLLWGLLCSSAAFWYFYGKSTVRAYYDQLEAPGAASSPSR